MKQVFVIGMGLLLLISMLALSSLAAAAPLAAQTPAAPNTAPAATQTRAPAATATPVPVESSSDTSPDANSADSADLAAPAIVSAVTPGPMTSRLFVFNPDTSIATVQIKIYNQTGVQVWDSTPFTVPQNGAVAKALTGVPSPCQCSAVLSADKNVQVIVTDANGTNTARDAYEGSHSPNATLILPFVRHLAVDTQKSIVAAQNTANSSQDITLTLYNNAGTVVATAVATAVPALSSYYFDTNNIFQSSTFVGTAMLTGSLGLPLAASEQTLFNKDTASFRAMTSNDDDKNLFVSYAERLVNSTTGAVINWTELYIRNDGGAPTDLTVKYYNSAGTPIATRSQTGVPPNGMASFSTKNSTVLASTNYKGTIKISSTVSVISAIAVDAQVSGAKLFGTGAIPASQLGAKFACGDTFHNSSQTSKINVLNTDAATANVAVTLYGTTGAQIATKTFSIAANRLNTITMSSTTFPELANFPNYEGMALVSATGAHLAVSVFTPFGSNGITSYDCNKLQ